MRDRQKDNSPTNNCLREMAGHVIWEIGRFRKAFHEWSELSNQAQPTNPDSLYGVIEIALLHYRALLEFFRSVPKQVCVDGKISVDIVATDYVGTSVSERLKTSGEELWKAYKSRIDQQLCHISTGRHESQIWRKWPTGIMKAKMEGLIRQFKESLPGERAVWFSSLTTSVVESTGKVSNGTPTVEVRPFPVPFSAPSASRR